jgi:hypothetical protein
MSWRIGYLLSYRDPERPCSQGQDGVDLSTGDHPHLVLAAGMRAAVLARVTGHDQVGLSPVLTGSHQDPTSAEASSGTTTGAVTRGSWRRCALAATTSAAWSSVTSGERSRVNGLIPVRSDTTHTPA